MRSSRIHIHVQALLGVLSFPITRMPVCAGYRISSMRCCTTLSVVVLFARILLFSSSYLFRTLMSTTAAFLEPCLIYLNISLRGYLRLYSHGWWRLLLHASHLRYAESRTCCVKTHQIQHCFLRLHCSIQSDACALASIPALFNIAFQVDCQGMYRKAGA